MKNLPLMVNYNFKIIILAALLISFSKAKDKGPSFSCQSSHKLSHVERMICDSDALTDVDLQLNAAYAKALATLNPDKKKQIKGGQKAWMKALSQCKNHDCIHTSLMTRLTEIDRLNK